MRAFKLFKAAAFLPSILQKVSSAAIANTDSLLAEVVQTQNNHTLVLQLDNSQATFNVSCKDCLGLEDADDALTFEFKALSADRPCGVSNLILNRQQLNQNWDGIQAFGQGVISTLPEYAQHNLSLSWESSCLFNTVPEDGINSQGDDVAQVLAVTIDRIDGKDVHHISGFTISFKQLSPPRLLRLAGAPDLTASSPVNAEAWRQPPVDLRIESLPVAETEFRKQLEELQTLQAEVVRLNDLIRAKEALISTIDESRVGSLKQEIQACETLSCIVKAIGRKTKTVCHDVYTKINIYHDKVMDEYAHRGKFGAQKPAHISPSDPKPESSNFHPTKPAGLLEWPSSTPSSTSDRLSNPFSDPHDSSNDYFTFSTSSGTRHIVASLTALFSIVILACFVVLRRCCCTERRRQDRRTRREERRNLRMYRRAARLQRWKDWWHGHRYPTTDYEEKRRLIIEQEEILEQAMQREIAELRNARDVVESLVQAEEGRANARIQDFRSGLDTTYVAESQWEPQPLSRTSSLPDYRSEAGNTDSPEYTSEDENSDVVVDGFRGFVPSSGSAHWTPDSSVIEVSPRQSMETMRISEEARIPGTPSSASSVEQ
ncbi:hypothetical protein M501DRAFT_995690 [Patellaria atrata CBS 101060]|uniref:Uncharacterized protein n=1 Tax=Patellaria atrata CBS 101060 TaxID=1346257 RepID=A0A9P4VL63_9PEZI|nr:hypothetical protein M501DRAFT_995690 [Patellaria atrata CBS 101060]